MRESLGEYSLLNRHTKDFEPVHLYRGIEKNNSEDFENLWKPAFIKKKAEMGQQYDAFAANMQDAHWEWPKKAEAFASRLDYETFAAEADNATQGLMVIDLAHHRGRLPEQKNQELVYIEFLATAPWNRANFTDQPKYKGIGRLMIGTAISASVDAGFKGRIALSALPQAAPWYRDVCKMTDLGMDANKGMHYFEMTEDQAQKFVKH